MADESLVHLRDPAGRPRGTGFAADHHGTVVTSHEAVEGLPWLTVRTAGRPDRVVTADAITPLPHLDLALVHTDGPGPVPLPVSVRGPVESGRYVRLAAGCWREARVLGTADVTYPAADRRHHLHDVLELAMSTTARDALRAGGGTAGGPVVDATTGAVVGVLGTRLRSGPRDTGFAVPLPGRVAGGPLGELLARNAATVPAYGADLNLAGVLELTATSMGCDGAPEPLAVPPVERAGPAREFAAFTAGPALVLGLVGPPGSGRTTELAALAARRGRAAEPTLWLRGADLHADDASVADAVRRALYRAARVLAAASPAPGVDPADLTPERVAHLARAVGRPLLLLLDGPEEMPPLLAHRLADWTDGTARWLRETGTRLVVAGRGEYWERAGGEFPGELLYRGGWAAASGGGGPFDGGLFGGGSFGVGSFGVGSFGVGSFGGGAPCGVLLGDLDEDEAREARARYGLSEEDLDPRDARHPLTLRLAAEVRAALPGASEHGRPDRYEVFSAHLDLMCLRIAVRLAAENGLRGTAVRRLAAKVAGQVHEAARRSLGPGQGELDREAFEAVFPWGPAPARLGGGTGWASAVLTEGLLVPAGDGYRFAHEELADWLQGLHLDLDEALRALVHRPGGPLGAHPLPVPHHRIGPVTQALLLLARPPHGSPARLAARLAELVRALAADPHSWWAARLLSGTLSRLPDATPYTDVLWLLAEVLAERGARGVDGLGGRGVTGVDGLGGRGVTGVDGLGGRRATGVVVLGERGVTGAEFGPGFWTGLALPTGDLLALLGRLVVTDGPPHLPGPRHLDAAARLLDADPAAVQPHLIRWFHDERPLPATPDATVATAAQALLHTHRHRAVDDLMDALVGSGHRRADELLAVLAEEEPSALRRAVDRWARDEREDPAVLESLLRAAVRYGGSGSPGRLRDLVHRTGLRLVRTPQGAARYDRALVGLARSDPGFAARLAGWLAAEPGEWAALVGPSARRMIENLAGARVPA
ncbi:serine protease [Streptomyces broussonetiae]|uniref:Serine protease n=1 Tax=Streptomyces broussonetiae TaxID=2686304 RepID=A0ABV5ELI9_9ACTN